MVLRWAGWVGRVLVAAGVLALLFAAYQLWGTGLVTAHDQAQLRTRLARELPPGASAAAARAARAAREGTGARRTAGGAAKPRAPGTAGPAPKVAPPMPTPAPGTPVGTLDIPEIDLKMVVVEGVTATDLAMGPGHYPGTPLPGEAGNVAIAGHRTTYLHPFYNLTAVVAGDAIVITTTQGTFTYVAQSQTVVAPTDVAVVGPSATPTLTLTTCNPRYSSATRLVLHATLTRSVLSARRPSPARSGAAGPTGADPRDRPASAGGLAGTPGPSGTTAPVLWGLGVAAVVATTALLGRHRRRRWLVTLPGALAALVVLFFFFAALSPLLPASI
jgi:sortase A